MIEDKILDTPEKIELATAKFIDLESNQGWILLKEMINANIVVLTEQILAGGDEEMLNLKRRDLIAYKNVINTPAEHIKRSRTPESPTPSFDPYDQPKELDKDVE